MTLPAPRLDDREFQDIVDDAKRRIARLAPEWTDHNVSDPGVALIELFAWMTEMILYRLNQVPDRMYVKFLELMGIELYGSVAASTDLLFTLTTPQAETVRIPAGIQVSTERVGQAEPVVFMTVRELAIVPPQLISCLTRTGGQFHDHTETLRRGADRVVCFSSLTPGDAFYLGFEHPLSANLIKLTVVTGVEGAGIDPDHPPLRWETWTGDGWDQAKVLADTSGALNAPEGGDITLLMPDEHAPVPIGQTRAYWMRCKLVEPEEDQPSYRRSPELSSLTAVSLGGAVTAHHSEPAPPELLGLSTGEPGQVFTVRRKPVLPRQDGESVRVLLPRTDGVRQREQPWTESRHFAAAGSDDQVCTWSDATGEIRFGPRLVDASGRARQLGAVPPVDAQITVTGYRHGGGRRGNVGAGKLGVLRTSIPYVASVTNLEAATGGVDPETIDNAKVRGPMSLRSGDRAVTIEDFERLTREAAPGVARARCLAPEPGEAIKVLIVPRVEVPAQTLSLTHLALNPELVSQVASYLDRRRLLTARVQIDEPLYQGLMIVAQVRAMAGIRAESIRENAVSALYDFVNPVNGGPAGAGWPFGQALNDGDIHALLRGIPGVATVGRVYFFLADLRTGIVNDQELQRIALPPDALLMSHQHQVVVEP